MFGWIISGDNVQNQFQIHTTTMISTEEIDQNLKRFFSTEDVEDNTTKLSEEEQFCEQHYQETHKRDNEGRYVVKMPFKENEEPKLGESRKIAMATLMQQEKKNLHVIQNYLNNIKHSRMNILT